jgi:heptosyltransferase-1
VHVLVIKTSSLGDVLHTLPALTDARGALTNVRFDWVVEEALAEIPGWHDAVERVIPIAVRRWRRTPLRAATAGELRGFVRTLRGRRYDAIIDAQGLLAKSVWPGLWAHGPRYGLDWASVREPLASLFYHHRIRVPKGCHAVERVRQLFAAALGYPLPTTVGDYGIDRWPRSPDTVDPAKLVFLHGTAWATKEWPVTYWRALIERAVAAGFRVHLTWGNARERSRAEALALTGGPVVVLDRLSLAGIAGELASAAGVVAVDTGLAHLAAALAVPTVALYGPTTPHLTGTYGAGQRHLVTRFPCAPCLRRTCRYPEVNAPHAPCFTQIPPEPVWQALLDLLASAPSGSVTVAPGAIAHPR